MTSTYTSLESTLNAGQTRRHLLATALAGCASLLPLAARATGAVNVNAQGVAVQGYDPVAYFLMSKPVKGVPEFSATWNGATYWFASASHRDTFQADPARYEPQYGGYCAFGVAQGAKPDIDPHAFAVVDGKLYLNLSPGVQKRWQADIPGHIQKANQNWLTLKNQ
ncbi:MAG: YHS domain protein [Hydrogenophaga sp.]|jgi:YHS domain-containing protein|nr:YHS domain protein [Hydrogenophaga sp.]